MATEKQKEDMSKIGWEIVSKAIHTACVYILVKENPTPDEEREIRELTEWFTENACHQPKCAGCEFHDISAVLNIYLTIVTRDYVAQIDVPSEAYAQDVYRQYNLIKNIAIAYWQHFTATRPEIMARLYAIRPDLDFVLTVDPKSPTTMFFDANSPKRVGIYGEYVDQKGRHLIKKPKK